MKKQTLLLLAAILLLLAIVLFCFINRSRSCSLSAPETLQVVPATPKETDAELDWSDVKGASGYQIVVFDLTKNIPFGTFDAVESEFTLTGLSSFHVYRASVSGKCSYGSPSTNVKNKMWRQGSIIIVDEDIMRRGTGLNNCACTDELGSIRAPITSDVTLSATDLSLNLSSTSRRAVYKFQLTNESRKRNFKIGFDYQCNAIKVLRDTCEEDDLRITVERDPIQNSTSIILKDNGNGNDVATFTPSSNGTSGSIAIRNLALGYRIEYWKCTGNWVPYCNEANEMPPDSQ